MKTKMLLLYSAIILMAGVIVSCSKNQDVDKVDQHNLAQQLKIVPLADRIKKDGGSLNRVKFIIVRWHEWGRKKKNCDGWGLCNAEWFPEFNQAMQNPLPSNGSESFLEFDQIMNKYYFDILLSDYPPSTIPDSELSLIVDEDIVLDLASEIGNNLVIKEGGYNYDQSLCMHGGYRIFLDVN